MENPPKNRLLVYHSAKLVDVASLDCTVLQITEIGVPPNAGKRVI
jgi:hypothetical protein